MVCVARSFFLFAFAMPLLAQRSTGSGGNPPVEQAFYDVLHYQIEINVEPETKTISGVTTLTAVVIHPMEWLVLDLDSQLSVEEVNLLSETSSGNESPQALVWERRDGQLWCRFKGVRQPGSQIRVAIGYGGTPRVAPRPPWVGGWTWAKTAAGEPWVATSCQLDGADLLFPCKDQPFDEADTVDLHITAPQDLTVASNGVLKNVSPAEKGRKTWHWHVSNAINNYGIAINIAPFKVIEDIYRSVTGENVPVVFYVLPEVFEKARAHFPEFIKNIAHLEKLLGPYPWRDEKLGFVHTPHLGMEHQTINAYGSNFEVGEGGFDWLHHHELCHEWFGNLITALDWRDFWVHESFNTYTQALLTEDLKGLEAYHRFIGNLERRLAHKLPLGPRESMDIADMYFPKTQDPPVNPDIHAKGAVVLHTMRYLFGKDKVIEGMRRLLYPTEAWTRKTGGDQCRFVTTADVKTVYEKVIGQDLTWLFEVYVRQPHLPQLRQQHKDGQLTLTWDVPQDLPFPMPVPVKLDGKWVRVEMGAEGGSISVKKDQKVEVDPENWIFRAK